MGLLNPKIATYAGSHMGHIPPPIKTRMTFQKLSEFSMTGFIQPVWIPSWPLNPYKIGVEQPDWWSSDPLLVLTTWDTPENSHTRKILKKTNQNTKEK